MEKYRSCRNFPKRSLSSPATWAALICFACWAAGLIPLRSGAAEAPSSITIGFTPGEESGLKERADAFAALLSKRTGLTLKAYVGKSYGDLIEQMANRKVDFAFLSASSFVEAETKSGAKVLLKKVWNGPFYYSVVLVSSSSKIQSIKALRKKRVAFVDEKSASGYLYPIAALRQSGLSEKTDVTAVFSGGHDRSVQMLRNGKVDAIAVFSNDRSGGDSAWTQHGGRRQDVRVLWSSAPIPNDPFVVRPDFYEKSPKIAHEVMFGIIEMNEDPELRDELRRFLGVQSLMLATSQQYEPVRQMVRLLERGSGKEAEER